MTVGDKIKAATKILKLRFPNLTTNETVDIAVEIVEATDG